VLEAGGIFVATHHIPPIGKPVTLHVHLPGGYEFQAYGVVAWTRETSTTVSEGLDAPPGFGARFTEISPQGRELINRYAANREPLFHDT
jgi:Tfp pilus assembly protein PilZ